MPTLPTRTLAMGGGLAEFADKVTIAYLVIHGAICWISDVQIILADVIGDSVYRAIYGLVGLDAVVDSWAIGQGDFLVELKVIEPGTSQAHGCPLPRHPPPTHHHAGTPPPSRSGSRLSYTRKC